VWLGIAAVVLLGVLGWLMTGSATKDAWLSISWDEAAGQWVELEKDGRTFGGRLENGFGTPLPPGQYALTVHQGREVILRQRLDLADGKRLAVYVPSPEAPAAPEEKGTPNPPAVAERPFVLPALPGRPEQRCATLGEAVQQASRGDTVEVRGNGPFDCPSLSLRKPLRLRAGAGSRPVLRLAPDSEDQVDLLNSRSALVLEGLELRRTGTRDPEAARKLGARLVTVSGRPLVVRNCRLAVEHNGAAVVANQVPLVDIRNSEILRAGTVASGLDWHSPAGGQLVIDNCAIAGRHHALYLPVSPHSSPAVVRIAHNTLLSETTAVLLRLNAGAWPGPPPTVQLDSEANLLACVGVLAADLDPKKIGRPLTAEESEALLPQVLAWQERGSCYPPAPNLLTLLPTPGRPRPTLADWEQLWGLKETQAAQDTPRFRGGNLLERVKTDFHSLTSTDFGLLTESPGQGKGVNVEMLGPGTADQRFQQTPEYQAWLQRVEALLR
jgi:hypothetical protein